MISLVVANEEEKDQRKRRVLCNGLLSMLLLRRELEGANALKVARKGAPKRVKVPWRAAAFQIIPVFRVVLLVSAAQSSR